MKADKADIKKLVDDLLALKLQYKEKHNKEYGSSLPAEQVSVSASQPAATETSTLVSKVSDDKTFIVTKPSYTSPAPGKRFIEEVSFQDILPESGLNLNKLETRLRFYSYVGGYLPTEDDKTVFSLVQKQLLDETDFPNTNRWFRNISAVLDTI